MTLAVETPAAPAAEAAPSTTVETPAAAPSEPAKAKNRAERRAEAMRSAIDANQKLGGRPAPVDPPPPVDLPPAAITALETPPPAAIEKPPTDSDAALRKAIEANIRNQREAYEAKQALKDRDAKLKQYEAEKAAREESDKKLQSDPFRRRIAEGATYEQVTQEMVEGKLKPPTAEESERESFKAEQARMREEWEAEKASRQKERDDYAAQQTAQREEQELTERATRLSAKLQENVATYPALAAVPWGAAHILRLHKADSSKTLDQHAQEFEQKASRDVHSVLKHGPSARALITDEVLTGLLDDAAFSQRVAKMLAAKQPTLSASPASNPQGETRSGNPPDAIPSSRANDPGDRAKPAKARTTADRVKRGLAAVQRTRRAPAG